MIKKSNKKKSSPKKKG